MTHTYSAPTTINPKSSSPASPVLAKLRGFAALRQGWDFGRGGPISEATLRNAELMLSIGNAIGYAADVLPGANDEVSVTFFNKNKNECVEAIVDAKGNLEIFVERMKNFNSDLLDHLEGATLTDLYKILTNWEPRPQWNSQDYSTPSILMFRTDGSGTSPSSQRPATARGPRMTSAVYLS